MSSKQQIHMSVLKAVLALLILICIWNMVFLPYEMLNYTVQASLIPMALAAGLLLWQLIYPEKCLSFPEKRERRYLHAAAFVLSVIFMLMLSVKELHVGNPFTDPLKQFVYILLLFVSCFIVIDRFLFIFTDKHTADAPSGKAPGKKDMYRWLRGFMAVYIVLIILHLWANFPFRASSDAIRVYRQIQLGEWGDHHPIGYILFFKLCMDLFSFVAWHPFSVTVVQSVLWVLIFIRICSILFDCLRSIKAVKVWCYGNLIIFIPLMYLGCAIKDTPYSLCLLGICGELFRLMMTKKLSRSDLAIMTLYLTGMTLFRHAGGISGILPLLLAAVLLGNRAIAKKILMSICIALAVFFITVYGIGFGILKMYANPPYMKYTVPLYVVANLLDSHEELFDEEDIEVCEYFMPIEDWKAAYNLNPYLADKVARGTEIVGDRIDLVDDEYGAEIIKLNARLLIRSPIDYIKAILKITSIIWQIARPADAYEQCAAGYWLPEDKPELIEERLITDHSWLADTLGSVQYFFHDQPLLSFIYYRGGIWLFICFFASAVLVLKRHFQLLLSILPPVIMSALMMLSCPEQDARYVFPVLQAGMFLIPAVFYITRKEDRS